MNISSVCRNNFIFCIQTFRIIVLTFNRPFSLQRLLTSLEASDYKTNSWELLLEIHIDGGGGVEGEKVREVANNFKFEFGSKHVLEEDVNIGVMAAWKNAWAWRENELFIVIEDDVEMSPHWFRALRNFWFKYGGRDDLAGVGLHLQKYIADPEARRQGAGRNIPDGVYLNQLPASIASSPHPYHWARMIGKYGDMFGSCPPGMACSPDVWEGWWLQYGLDNTLFTLFLGGDRALAVDHREEGLHTAGDQGKLSEAVESWEDSWELVNLPVELQRWDVAMEEISQLKYLGMKLGRKFGMTMAMVEKKIVYVFLLLFLLAWIYIWRITMLDCDHSGYALLFFI